MVTMSGDAHARRFDSESAVSSIKVLGLFLTRLGEATGGRSHAQIAKELDMSSETVRRYRAGKSAPSVEFLRRLAIVYGINLNWLLLGTGSENSKDDSRRVIRVASPTELCLELARQMDSMDELVRRAESRHAAAIKLFNQLLETKTPNGPGAPVRDEVGASAHAS